MPTNEKLLVPPFNKKDIEEIVKELTKNTFESYPKADGILEIDADDQNYHDLTPEILAFILHCFEVGKINYNDYLSNLNFANYNPDINKIDKLCFGCNTGNEENNHTNAGFHLEIDIDYENNKYRTYSYEI